MKTESQIELRLDNALHSSSQSESALKATTKCLRMKSSNVKSSTVLVRPVRTIVFSLV